MSKKLSKFNIFMFSFIGMSIVSYYIIMSIENNYLAIAIGVGCGISLIGTLHDVLKMEFKKEEK